MNRAEFPFGLFYFCHTLQKPAIIKITVVAMVTVPWSGILSSGCDGYTSV